MLERAQDLVKIEVSGLVFIGLFIGQILRHFLAQNHGSKEESLSLPTH